MKNMVGIGRYLTLIEIFLIVFIPTYFFAHFGVDTLHDGLVFTAPLDVLKGKVLYKDVYYHFGFLSNYISVFFLKFFGAKLLSLRLGASIFYSLTAIVIYLIGIRFYEPWKAFLTVIIWLGLAPYFSNNFYAWPSVYANLFFAMDILLVSLIYKKKKQGELQLNYELIFLMGIMSAISFWIKQPYLIVLVANISLFVLLYLIKVINRNMLARCITISLLGFGLVSLVIIFYLLKTNSIVDWLKQDLVFAYIWVRIVGGVNQTAGKLTVLIKKPLYVFIPLGLILFFVQNLQNMIKNKSTAVIEKLSISFIAIFTIFLYYPYADDKHLFWAVTSIIPVFMLFILDYRNRFVKPKHIIMLFTLIYAIYLIQKVPRIISYIGDKKFQIDVPHVLGGVLVTKEDYIHFNEVSSIINNYLSKNKDKVLANKGWNPLYMTFTDKSKNIQSMYYDNSGYTSGLYNYQGSLNVFIQNNKPLVLSLYNEKEIAEYCLLYLSEEHNLSIYAPESEAKNYLECI